MNKKAFSAALLTVAWQCGLANEIQFDKLFTEGMSHPIRDTVLIQIDDSSVLVFSATTPIYYLEGKNLVISAKAIRLDGKVTISSFSKPAAAHLEAASHGTDRG